MIDEKYIARIGKWKKKYDAINHVISKIEESKSLSEVKASVTALINYYDANPKDKKQLCEQLREMIVRSGGPYMKPLPTQDKNVVFIPTAAAPVVMIPAYVPIADDDDLIYDGLHRLMAKIDEFSDPIEDIVTEEEINAVLDAAQKKFRILDIVAPVKPLMIVFLGNSHAVHNCECGIADSAVSREAVIFVYHPRDVSKCDRVFIFAHEIGHALNLALTGDIGIIPDGFDVFNETLGIRWQTTHQKQEAFADVAAFSILNGKRLKKHLPHPFSKPMLNCFDKYIGSVINNVRTITI